MIIDCFPYFQEADLAELRMRELDPFVDAFVVAEGNRTHAGAAKASYFPSELFERWKHKLLLRTVDLPEGDGLTWTWRREIAQRNALLDGCRRLGCQADDMILISDCDEIPSIGFVSVLAALPPDGIAVANQRMFYYTFNHEADIAWRGTRATQFANVEALGADGVRYAGWERGGFPRLYEIADAGWHFSYFGGADAIQRKMTSFLHQEFNLPEHTDIQTIEERVEAGKDVYGREHQNFAIGWARELPNAVLDDPTRWQHHFHHGFGPRWLGAVEPGSFPDRLHDMRLGVLQAPSAGAVVILGDLGGRLTVKLSRYAGTRPIFLVDRYASLVPQHQTWRNLQAFGVSEQVTHGMPPADQPIAALIEWYPQVHADIDAFRAQLRTQLVAGAFTSPAWEETTE